MLNEILKNTQPSELDLELQLATELSHEIARKRAEEEKWSLYRSQVEAKWFPFLAKRQAEFEVWLSNYEERKEKSRPQIDWSKC